jgi:DNA polymerase-4
VIIRGNDMKKHSHQRMLDAPTDSTSRTYEVAKELYRQLWDGRTGLRLIGLAMTQIDRDGEQQLSLFDALGSGSTAEEDERDHKADAAVDALREKFGDDIIKRGGMLGSNIRPRKRK